MLNVIQQYLAWSIGLVYENADFFFTQYFRLILTYPPLAAGRLPDGKRAPDPKNGTV